jgi:hypothetical protein
MRKPAVVFALGTVVLSLAGAALRCFEFRSARDPETGLFSFVPVTGALIALSVLAAVFFLVFSRRVKADPSADYDAAFHPATPVPVILSALMLLAVIWAAVIGFTEFRQGKGLAPCILAALAFLAASAELGLDLSLLRGKKGDDRFFSLVLQIVFVCVLIIIYYKTYSAVPSLSAVMYDFLGLCAAAWAMYCLAGFSVGRGKAGQSLAFSGAAVYFCCISLAGSNSTVFTIYYVYLILRLFKDSVLLSRNVCSFDSAAVKKDGGAA